jgi:opacity protein-like surface antigen
MGGLQKSHFEFTNIQWLEGVNLNYFSFARPTYMGSFGVSVTAMTSGDIEMTTTQMPDGTGDYYSATSYALSVGYARQMTDFFSFGLSAKYISERISEEVATGVAFDFGTMLHTGYRNLRIGMNIANLGPSMRFEGPELNFNYDPSPGNEGYDQAQAVREVEPYDLPLTFRLGVAYDLNYAENGRLTLTAEARDPADNEQQASIGTEMAFNEQFFLRAGWKFNYVEEGLTLGGGLSLALWENTDFDFNYAWADFGRLESVHRFSLGFEF